MRILAITHQYPTAADPTFAPYNRQQFAELARRHELRIIRPVPWPQVLAETIRTGGRVVDDIDGNGIRTYRPTFRYPPRILRHWYGAFFEHSVAAPTRRVLDTYQPDVLLSAWAHPDGWATTRIGRRLGLPVVVKVIGSDVLVLATGARRKLVREALVAADAVIAVSHNLASHVAALGVPPERVHVVPEGLSPTQFSPGDRQDARRILRVPDDERMILFVGNVRESKGVTDLVHACARLRDGGVEFHCRLVGTVQNRGAVERLVRSHRLEAHVELMGVRPHHELTDWYRASDIVTLPSHSEGIPNVLREALACGKPFVATRIGGIPEIADPSFSRLVPVGADADLADALRSMIDSPPAVDAERVRRINISWEESARLLAGHMEDAIAQRAAERARPRTVLAKAGA